MYGGISILLLHYSWFDWHWSGNGQNMNFGFWKKLLAQIIADYVYFHMVYQTIIWNHCGCHRKVLNMTHFQLFAWFIQTLLVRKMVFCYQNCWPTVRKIVLVIKKNWNFLVIFDIFSEYFHFWLDCNTITHQIYL